MNEFRGVWLATVGNLDWPSAPATDAVSAAMSQIAELNLAINNAHRLGLNAIIFQVRPCCDAFYQSEIEPWSEFLTGEQGKALSIGEVVFDALSYAIETAHARGLQLHAWINPFRARFSKRLSPPAQHHVSVTHPHLVKDYGDFQWLDPGEAEAQERALAVVRDILRRYDVDGLHIDDYFYPYKMEARDFPDDESWARYRGPLSRDDWRRDNVNRFVEALWRTVKSEKPQAQFGISPFGIWRPDNPPGIKGLDAYAELYADARLWLQNGWADYFAPQLYWKIEPPQQSFPALLDWWQAQNPQVPVYAGLYTSRIHVDNWPIEEIARQIEITRERGAGGHIHFSARALCDKSLQKTLRELYGT